MHLLTRILAAGLLWLAYAVPLSAATLLPPGKIVFLDTNGRPLIGGSVQFYAPGTTTPKTTWQDAAQTVANTNPVVLDAGGRAIIYGAGAYRQVVKDSLGNTVWDQLTADVSSAVGIVWCGTTTGSANAQTCATTGYTATTGAAASFAIGNTNTGATTLNIGGTGTFAVYKDTALGPVALTGGELIAGNTAQVVYDSTISAYHLVNPAPARSCVLNNNRRAVTGAYTLTAADSGMTIAASGEAFYAVTFNAASTYVNPCFQVRVKNDNTTRAISVVMPSYNTLMLWPGQTIEVFNDNNAWASSPGARQRWAKGGTTFYVDPIAGNDNNDCLATGSGACQTMQAAYLHLRDDVDHQGGYPTLQLANGTYNGFDGAGANFAVTNPLVGTSLFFLKGSNTACTNVVWNVAAGGTNIYTRDFGIVEVEGVYFNTGGSGSTAISASQFGVVDLNANVCFGAYPGGYHMSSIDGGAFNVNSGYIVAGGAAAHILVTGWSKFVMTGGVTITLNGGPTFSTAYIQGNGITYITLGTNTYVGGASGPKYNIGNYTFLNAPTLPTVLSSGTAAANATCAGAAC